MTTNTDITNTTEETTRQGPPEVVPLCGDEPAMREWANELVERAHRDGVNSVALHRHRSRSSDPPTAQAAA